MRVLFNTHNPANLTHGGTQIQIERTKQALTEIGVEADYFQWWNSHQSAGIFHHVGSLPYSLLRTAQQKGWKVVVTLLLTETCNRSEWELFTRAVSVRTAMSLLPRKARERLPWHAFRECDLMVVGLEAERMVLERVYGIPASRVAVVPLGLTDTFLKAGPPLNTESHLICTGTVGPLKNSVEIARLAHAAQVPILFVGKPHDYNSDYWTQFQQLVDDQFVKHQPHVSNEELVDWLRRARGYVLMSQNENWSLAAHEAAACGLPMLLPDQRWSRERFGGQATFFPKAGSDATIAVLKRFYDQCPQLGAPKLRLLSWREVAEQLRGHYTKLLNSGAEP
jgi:glycosyltransferase involved in cell wall biosynthesis